VNNSDDVLILEMKWRLGNVDTVSVFKGGSGEEVSAEGTLEGQEAPDRPLIRGLLCCRFADPEIEAAYQAHRQRRVAQHARGVVGTFVCAAALLFMLTFAGDGTLVWVQRLNFLVDIAILIGFGMLFHRFPQRMAWWYEPLMTTVLAHIALVCSLLGDRLATALDESVVARGTWHPGFFTEAGAVAVISGVAVPAPLFAQLSVEACLLLVHLLIPAHVLGHLALGSDEYASLMILAELPSHSMAAIVLGAQLYCFEAMALAHGIREEHLRRLHFRETYSENTDEMDCLQQGSEAAKVLSTGGEAGAASPAPRVLTAPPPPAMRDLKGFVVKHPLIGDTEAPNPKLVQAMYGTRADDLRIMRMAERIHSPSYSLKEFFNDCIESFPELRLFFLGDKNISSTSGESNEGEYQRTIGALFAVYWLLRLQGDGKIGWCYGHDEDWKPLHVQAPSKSSRILAGSARKSKTNQEKSDAVEHGMTFFQMNESQKRASFLATMSWQMFENLVSQAGCAHDNVGSTQRVMGLLCLTAFHDIMKVADLLPTVQPEHSPYMGYNAGDVIRDHDVALIYVLEHYPHLIPSFASLPAKEQKVVLFSQGKMNFNHGWFVQAEAPPGPMLSAFKSVLNGGAAPADVSFYFLHWFTDLAGADATPLGGAEKFVLRFPHAVLSSFLWSIPYLRHLTLMSETEVVEIYLKARWRVIAPGTQVPDDEEAIACMRLAVMAQSDTQIVDLFQQLPRRDRTRLAMELARTGCPGQRFSSSPNAKHGPALLIYYSPALMQKNVDGDLMGALRILSEVFRLSRSIWPLSSASEGITVTIQVAQLKTERLDQILDACETDPQQVWLVLRHNDLEGSVERKHASEVVELQEKGIVFKLLDIVQVCRGSTKQPEVSSRSSSDTTSERDGTTVPDESTLLCNSSRRTSNTSRIAPEDPDLIGGADAFPDLAVTRRGTLCAETELAALRQENWLLHHQQETMVKELEWLRNKVAEMDPDAKSDSTDRSHSDASKSCVNGKKPTTLRLPLAVGDPQGYLRGSSAPPRTGLEAVSEASPPLS